MSASASSGRRADRDMLLRTSPGYRVTCFTTPLIPALWSGISGVFSRQTTVVFIVVALVLGTAMAGIWTRAFVQLDRGTLRYRLWGPLREVPIAEVGYPEQRSSRLQIPAGGKTVRLYQRVWRADDLDALCRELVARRSAVARSAP